MEVENILPSSILGDGASNTNRNNHPHHDYNSAGLQQCYEKGGGNENLLSGCSMPETAVISDDVSYCVAITAGSPANIAALKREDQGLVQQTVLTCQLTDMVSPISETNLYGKRNSFQEDVEILLQLFQNEYSQSQTPNFYHEKLKSLIDNHIHELLNEKDKLDIEFQKAQTKLNENSNLITKRLNTIENILCSSTVLNKFSELQIDAILLEEKRGIQGIKSKLIDSVGCSIISAIVKDSILTEASFVSQPNTKMEENKAKRELQEIKKQNILEVTEEGNHKQNIKQENIENLNPANIEINRISRELKQSQAELKTVKIELEDKINTIRQHAHYEQGRILEINNLEAEVKRINIHFWQTQNELKVVKKELNEKILTIQQAEQEEIELIKEREELLQKLVNTLRNELEQTENEMEAVKEELNDKISIIEQMAQHDMKELEDFIKIKEEVITLQKQLAGAENELIVVKRELTNDIFTIQEKNHREQKLMEEHNKAKVNKLQNRLSETEDELKKVKKDLSRKSDRERDRDSSRKSDREQDRDSSRRRDRDLSRRSDRDRDRDLSKRSDKEQDGDWSRRSDREQDRDLSRRSDRDRDRDLSRRSDRDRDSSKRSDKEQDGDWSRRSDREQDRDLSRRRDRAQHEQKLKKEFDDEEEKEVKVLQNLLTATQYKLEAVTKELNRTVNSIEQNIEQEQKLSEVGYREIRMMLVKKLGFTDRNSRHFESYMKEEDRQGIVSDIQRLVKDKVQLWEEPISETDIGSNILKVTEIEVHLVVAIACFLKVVPFSASTDFVYSFVAQIDNVISRQHVESLLKKFPTIFNEESVGAGSSNKNWKYLDLKPIITI